MANDNDFLVVIQNGTNCAGETVTRVVLRKVRLKTRRGADAVVNVLLGAMEAVAKGIVPPDERHRRISNNHGMHFCQQQGRCMLNLELCWLNSHVEYVLRNTLIKFPNVFDGINVCGEDVETQSGRFQEISNIGLRCSPPMRSRPSTLVARVLRDILRGNDLEQLSMTSIPIVGHAAEILFEGLKTTRRNSNLKRIRLRGSSFQDDIDTDHDHRSSPAQQLACGLRLNATLVSLDISMIFWNDRQLANVLEAIVDHPTLRILDLEGSVVGPLSLQALKRVLQSRKCRIKLLDLSQLNKVRDQDSDEALELDKSGLMDALDASHSLEQVRLHQTGLCTYLDLTRIIRFIRHHPRLYQLSHDEFLPDGTPRMQTIGLRSTIRALLHYHRSCHLFVRQAATVGAAAATWAHCLARVNRISRNDSQRAHALYPLVHAMVGVPGALEGRHNSDYECTEEIKPNPSKSRSSKRKRQQESSVPTRFSSRLRKKRRKNCLSLVC